MDPNSTADILSYLLSTLPERSAAFLVVAGPVIASIVQIARAKFSLPAGYAPVANFVLSGIATALAISAGIVGAGADNIEVIALFITLFFAASGTHSSAKYLKKLKQGEYKKEKEKVDGSDERAGDNDDDQ